MKRLAILQSNYIPWRGYFDMMASVDEFMLYDVADYTKNDWRNRNRIKTATGPLWLTIPVLTKGRGRQPIDAVEIMASDWASRHRKSIAQAYAAAPYHDHYAALLDDLYATAATLTRLAEVNRLFLRAVRDELAISSMLTDARDHHAVGDPTARLVQLCTAVGATHYVSGPAAQAYLDLAQFEAVGLVVEWFSYDSYLPHPQLHGDPVSNLSIIDSLLNMGPATAQLLHGGNLTPPRGTTATSIDMNVTDTVPTDGDRP